MDKHILWNKIARIIMQLSETLDITPRTCHVSIL